MTPHPTPRAARALPRRDFLAGAAALAAAAAGCAPNPLAPGRDAGAGGALSPLRAAADAGLPDPKKSGIEHIVVVMMENRSFDHLLGWVPGAEGPPAGLTYRDAANVPHPIHALAPDFQGCGHPDPDHSAPAALVEYADGRCDGWLKAGKNDLFSIGYYQQKDLAFFGQAVADWTTSDRYFAAILGPTFPNRFYQHAARTDRTGDSFEISSLPTIWDRLAQKGLTGRYYYTDLPFTALWGFRHLNISRPASEFFAACATGDLPHVSFVDQSFVGEFTGLGSDDHPHTDVRAGEHYLNQVYEAVTGGPARDKTLLVINFDEWGGFFDHVRPEAALPAPAGDPFTNGLRGFRVPLLLVSPFARQRGVRRVGDAQLDHTSVLRMIEWRFGLDALTTRDARAVNLAQLLDFTKPSRVDKYPRYAVPDVQGKLCIDNPFFGREVPATASAPNAPAPDAARTDSPAGPAGAAQRARLREIALAHGFAVGR